MRKQFSSFNRRQALIGSTAAAFIASTSPAFAVKKDMKEALRMLAGKLFYSNDRPGRWKGKEKGHSPLIKIDKMGNDVLIRAAIRHSMNSEHHITKHMLLDANLNFIQEQYFDMDFDMPRSRFELNDYKGRVFIVSLCNKHDNWINWADI